MMKSNVASAGLLSRSHCPHCQESTTVLQRTSIEGIARWPKFSGDHYQLDRLELPPTTPLEVRWCGRCALGFSDPLLGSELIGRLYNDVIQKEQARQAYDASQGWRQRHVSNLLKDLERFVPPRSSRRLLDFGAGWGLLLREARARGWQAAGIELANKERASLHTEGFQVFASLDDVPDESFDAAGSTQVLEHVPDFHAIIRSQANKLRPGGLLYIDVPNAGPWARRQAGLFANPLEHVNYFTHQFLSRRLLDAKKFQLVWPRLAAPPKQAWRALRQQLGSTPLTVLFRKRCAT